MDFLQLLSCACIIFTVGMFTTGLTDLKKMKATQSADNVQFLPFLTTCLNNLGWLYYGLLKGDGTVISVNIIGACLQTLYIITYCHYTKDKRRVFSQTLTMVSVLCVGWVYFTVVIPSGEAQLSQLGLACSVFTISMYLSPLTDLVTSSQCFYEESASVHLSDSAPRTGLTGYSVPLVLKKKNWYRNIFVFLVPTWYRSTGSFDNTTHSLWILCEISLWSACLFP
uniref:Sugar transporter SWEET n=2 Tax=Cyprinus carpio carpio TaxID=630221 RepID=A0A9J8CQ89_CYPCA